MSHFKYFWKKKLFLSQNVHFKFNSWHCGWGNKWYCNNYSCLKICCTINSKTLRRPCYLSYFHSSLSGLLFCVVLVQFLKKIFRCSCYICDFCDLVYRYWNITPQFNKGSFTNHVYSNGWGEVLGISSLIHKFGKSD